MQQSGGTNSKGTRVISSKPLFYLEMQAHPKRIPAVERSLACSFRVSRRNKQTVDPNPNPNPFLRLGPEKMLCQVHAVRLIAVRATHDLARHRSLS